MSEHPLRVILAAHSAAKGEEAMERRQRLHFATQKVYADLPERVDDPTLLPKLSAGGMCSQRHPVKHCNE